MEQEIISKLVTVERMNTTGMIALLIYILIPKILPWIEKNILHKNKEDTKQDTEEKQRDTLKVIKEDMMFIKNKINIMEKSIDKIERRGIVTTRLYESQSALLVAIVDKIGDPELSSLALKIISEDKIIGD